MMNVRKEMEFKIVKFVGIELNIGLIKMNVKIR